MSSSTTGSQNLRQRCEEEGDYTKHAASTEKHLVWWRVVVHDDLLEGHQHRHCPCCCSSHLPARVFTAKSQYRRVNFPLRIPNRQKECSFSSHALRLQQCVCERHKHISVGPGRLQRETWSLFSTTCGGTPQRARGSWTTTSRCWICSHTLDGTGSVPRFCSKCENMWTLLSNSPC